MIELLPCKKERGRLLADEFLSVPGIPGLWAAGDSAAIPDGKTDPFHPPAAQHGLRQGRVAARNIEAVILGRPVEPFVYSTQGQLATIGRRTGVAKVFGLKFCGFFAWWLWRTVYLLKLPRLAKKLRVMFVRTLDLFFGREVEQMITLRDVEAVTQRLDLLRQRTKKQTDGRHEVSKKFREDNILK